MSTLWLVGCAAGLAASGCTSGPNIPDGTYALTRVGDSCYTQGTTSITFAGDAVVDPGFMANPLPSHDAITNTVIDGTHITFDRDWGYRNSDSGDYSSSHEHFAVTVDATTLSGTLDASYAGKYSMQMWSCMPTFTVTGTRS